MKVFGITGGVGAGKSEVLTYLGQNYDATVIQADEAGYLVMLPGGECYGEIVKLFGRQITTETGELDRKRIAEIVFQDEEKLKALNAIVHPAVKRYIKKAIAAAEKAGTEYVFVEAALLIEEKYDEICDELWYIYADEEVRKERLIEGRGYSEKKVREIMANELSEDESAFLQDINGREFIHLIETTNMTKVYKMPVLMAFYNHGDIRMEVTEQQLLASWKEFFSTGTNWKDLDKDMTYEKYMAISDKEHINKILKMPVNYLQLSGDGFFVKRDGCALALSEKLKDVIDNPVFVDQMGDVIRYRTMDYYQRRYRGI